MAKEDGSNAVDYPVKYTKEEVGNRLTDKELEELNSLADDFDKFSDNEDDPRYQRWMDLNRRASGI